MFSIVFSCLSELCKVVNFSFGGSKFSWKTKIEIIAGTLPMPKRCRSYVYIAF